MVSLIQLKKENIKLKAAQERKEEFKRAKIENIRLKNPKKVKFFRAAGRFGKVAGGIAGRGVKKLGKKAIEAERRSIERRRKSQGGKKQQPFGFGDLF